MSDPAAKLSLHFSISEMQCPCCGQCDMDAQFMRRLERLRLLFGRPLVINSGYRCKEHNASLKGSSPKSLHTQGLAADISWDEFDGSEKWRLLGYGRDLFSGLGIAKTYLHVQHGDRCKLWVY